MKKYLLIFAALIIIVAAYVIGFNHPAKETTVQAAPKKSYIALGDSVAAGVGLSTASDSSACDRTDQGYPHVLASKLNYALTNLSCSGATLPAGILGSQNVNQLNATPQLTAMFAKPAPELITITIGANDADWTSILAKCYTGECGTASDTAAVNARLAVVQTNLSSLFAQIKTHYGSNLPKVIVTGYHQVFPAAGVTCSDLTGINASELAWGRGLQTSINTTIASAVTSSGYAKFVPINFSGHELCTTDSWVQGTADKMPYHPTEAGQAAFAAQIQTVVKTLN